MNDDTNQTQGQVTGGKWMGRVVQMAQTLSYGLGLGTGAIVTGGQIAIEGLMNAIGRLADGAVSEAHRLGAYISKSSGAHYSHLQGLNQKPFADNDAPSLTGLLKNAFAAGAKDGEKKLRALNRSRGMARDTFEGAI